MENYKYKKFLEILKENNFQKKLDKLAKKYKNKKVVLYGAGFVCDIILDNFDISKLNIIAIADIRYKDSNETYKGIQAIPPTEIYKYEPAIVFITMQHYIQTEDYFENILFPVTKKFKYQSILVYSFSEFLKKMLGIPL